MSDATDDPRQRQDADETLGAFTRRQVRRLPDGELVYADKYEDEVARREAERPSWDLEER